MSEQTKEQILTAKIRDLLQASSFEEIDWSTFGPQTTIESIGLDSLTMLDLLYDVEQDMGVRVDAKEVVSFRTVGDMTALLIAKGA